MKYSNKLRVSVTFSITFDYQRFIPEDELNDPSSPWLGIVRTSETIEGALNISAKGQPDVHFRDILAPWIQNLCFRGVWELARGQSVTVNYFGRSGKAVFTPQHSRVQLISDHNPEAIYPQADFLHALANCGSRFVAFAEIAKKDDRDYMANLNYVRGFEAQAHDALGSIPLAG